MKSRQFGKDQEITSVCFSPIGDFIGKFMLQCFLFGIKFGTILRKVQVSGNISRGYKSLILLPS